jgi:hypothetical protein
MSRRALQTMYQPATTTFPQTVRRGSEPGRLVPEGTNLRYAAIAALGIAQLPEDEQRAALRGVTAAQLCGELAGPGASAPDLGAAALVAWASAEITGSVSEALIARIVTDVRAALPQPTVDYAWALTALVAARDVADVGITAQQAADRLMAAAGAEGIFPHALPREVLGRVRAHVGCFADQVYPIQALARFHAAADAPDALAAADRCAERIVALQGDAGQWWWHYDVRTGDVVEGFPVYSVHQHAMAPMALFDLAEAGGKDHLAAIARGLRWIEDHPETEESLLDPASGAIWRKVGRRERKKAVRAIRSASTSIKPSLHLRGLDRLFPPGPVDHECRPYELGWLLYAWLAGGVVRHAALSPATPPAEG